MALRIGDKVVFGRSRGEMTLGEVVKVNAKTVKIRQLELRGRHAIGTVWTVAANLCTPVVSTVPNTTSTPAAPQETRSESAIMQEIQALESRLKNLREELVRLTF